MSKIVKIDNVARIEGHASVAIYVAEDNTVENVEFVATEPSRGFDTIFRGRHASEIPRLAARICGICYTAHNICACKALEDAWDVEIPQAAKDLRRLLLFANTLSSHALHFFFLAAPGLFLEVPSSFEDLQQKHPDLVNAGLKLRMIGQEISEIISGRKVHTILSAPGGMMGGLDEERQDRIMNLLDSSRSPLGIMESYSNGLLSSKRSYLTEFGKISTHFLSLGQSDLLQLYDSPLELQLEDGTKEQLSPAVLLEELTERETPYSYVRHPFLTKYGPERGQFRVGPLARIQNARWDSPSFREFKWSFGELTQSPLGYHIARVPEMEECIRGMRSILLSGIDKEVKNVARPREGIGVAVLEAPRGLLLHQYETDGAGMIRSARVIAPTTFHQGSIERSTLQAARTVMSGQGDNNSIANKVNIELVIRAYDPCMSCAGATQLRIIKKPYVGEWQ